MRRASLVLSLVLIVAIVVGYAARRSELAGDRDVRLTTSADLGATRVAALIDVVTIAAAAGADPSIVADAVAATDHTVGVCVVTAAPDAACAGRGPQPTADRVDAARQERLTAVEAAPRAVDVMTYDALMTLESVGPEVTVLVRAPTEVSGVRSDINLWTATFLPAATRVGEFAVDRGVRQTAALVPGGGTELYIIASGDDAVELPADEQRFYLIVFTLALILLVLAGITLVVEQRSLVERASFDNLTKLPNRSEFERRAAEAIAAADRLDDGLCLLLFDLNGFKRINDTYGHYAGDEILKVVGSRLRKSVRDGDIVARWGGDEFVVVMPGIATEEMGTRRARQLAEQVGGRTRLDGIEEALRIQVSVGVALRPDHGDDLDALVEAADQAMYQAKRDGEVCRTADPPPEPTTLTTV